MEKWQKALWSGSFRSVANSKFLGINDLNLCGKQYLVWDIASWSTMLDMLEIWVGNSPFGPSWLRLLVEMSCVIALVYDFHSIYLIFVREQFKTFRKCWSCQSFPKQGLKLYDRMTFEASVMPWYICISIQNYLSNTFIHGMICIFLRVSRSDYRCIQFKLCHALVAVKMSKSKYAHHVLRDWWRVIYFNIRYLVFI